MLSAQQERSRAEERDHVLGKQHLPAVDSYHSEKIPSNVLKELADRPTLHELENSHLQNVHVENLDSTKCAFQTVAEEMEKNKNIAQFVELKLETEAQLLGEGIVLSSAVVNPPTDTTEDNVSKSPRLPPSPRPEPNE